ncbi:hypothetical protein [Pedobacter miscanthi]|jgi:hypothetical protein|uniref:hypothetical protein n=1 Tax=Pedobacter miscanthi TaxID=2259170 RepID=UPI0029311B19|nr:hypothetical protein [Pedobacter miscanthi]
MEMNDENNKKEIDPQPDANHDQEIDWDNGEATYGHKRTDFKRKDQPDEAHLEKTENAGEHDVNTALKNANLSQNDDIGSRNKEANKGLKGTDQ